MELWRGGTSGGAMYNPKKKGWGGKSPQQGKTGVNPIEGEESGGQEQEVNVFTKGKGKGGYRPYQGAWNSNPTGTGYQGVCWGCGEIGHQQKECPKRIQNVNCDNLECDFFFGAVEVAGVEKPPVSEYEREFRKVKRGVKFGGCQGKCGEECDGSWNKTGNKFAVLSEEEDEYDKVNKDDNVDDIVTNGEGKGKGKEKMKRVKKVEWKKMDLCTVEGEKENSSTIKVDFQVAAVKNPLMSVQRICENGNRVCFGPNGEDNYVENVKTSKRVSLRPNGKGSYLLDAKFKGGEDISVVVDSGAEENVCPTWWGEQFGMTEPKAWLNFSGANGASITHYGKRAVVMESTF